MKKSEATRFKIGPPEVHAGREEGSAFRPRQTFFGIGPGSGSAVGLRDSVDAESDSSPAIHGVNIVLTGYDATAMAEGAFVAGGDGRLGCAGAG